MYTKGKWYWKNEEPGTEDLAKLLSDNGEEICDFGNGEQYYPSSGSEPSDDDKKLIAAAPDLLQAVQEFIVVINKSPTALEYYGDAINRGKAAILKAVGVV